MDVGIVMSRFIMTCHVVVFCLVSRFERVLSFCLLCFECVLSFGNVFRMKCGYEVMYLWVGSGCMFRNYLDYYYHSFG